VVALARLARIVLPWNPVVWLLSSRLVRAIELDCDRRVLRRCPDVGSYGTTLLDISARRPGRLLALAAFAESEAPLRSRILAMTTPPRSVSLAAILSSVVLGVVLLVGALEIPVPAPRIRIDVGPPAQGLVQAATPPTFRPSSTRPRLLNEDEVQRPGRAEIEKLAQGLHVETSEGSPTSVLMPSFTPMSVRPVLLNREAVARALVDAYPQDLRDAGVEGSTTLLLRVAPDGLVQARRVERSAGHESLDEAALGIADIMRFQPALNRDQRVPVWVSLPVTFAVGP
jgi:TonB family protein